MCRRVHYRITTPFRRSNSAESAKKSTKRPRPKLNIPLPQIQINGNGESVGATTHKAQTTTTEMPQLRHRVRGVADQEDVVRRGSTPSHMDDNKEPNEHDSRNGDARRCTLPNFHRGISEERRGTLSHTPRAFKLRQLTLNYDRTKMKAPSQADEPGNTPTTPMMEGSELGTLGSSKNADSYQPRIVASSWNWSAMLARHYYSFSNLKLLVTIVINVLLLFYKVSSSL